MTLALELDSSSLKNRSLRVTRCVRKVKPLVNSVGAAATGKVTKFEHSSQGKMKKEEGKGNNNGKRGNI